MIRNTPDNVLYGDSGRVLLNGRVTLNVKKAALNASDPSSLPGIRKHLQGALAEHRHTELIRAGENGVDDIIPVGHVNGNGPDRVLQAGNIVDVVEVKALGRAIGHGDIKTWLLKTVDENGDTIYQFNGPKLDQFLRRAGTSLRDLLGAGKQIRYNLFIYDANPSVAGDLANIFSPGTRIPIKGIPGAEIVLDTSSHWDP
jgi:hypothetical protein